MIAGKHFFDDISSLSLILRTMTFVAFMLTSRKFADELFKILHWLAVSIL